MRTLAFFELLMAVVASALVIPHSVDLSSQVETYHTYVPRSDRLIVPKNLSSPHSSLSTTDCSPETMLSHIQKQKLGLNAAVSYVADQQLGLPQFGCQALMNLLLEIQAGYPPLLPLRVRFARNKLGVAALKQAIGRFKNTYRLEDKTVRTPTPLTTVILDILDQDGSEPSEMAIDYLRVMTSLAHIQNKNLDFGSASAYVQSQLLGSEKSGSRSLLAVLRYYEVPSPSYPNDDGGSGTTGFTKLQHYVREFGKGYKKGELTKVLQYLHDMHGLRMRQT